MPKPTPQADAPRVAHHHNLRLPEADYQEFRRRAYANGTNITAEILAAYRGQREPLENNGGTTQ